MTRTQRKRLHEAINRLTREETAAIVKKVFHTARGERVDVIARQVISGAHAEVSPKK